MSNALDCFLALIQRMSFGFGRHPLVKQRQRHVRHSIGYRGLIVRSRRVHQRRVAGCVELNNANVLDRCRGQGKRPS